jgi:hypothetical protein
LREFEKGGQELRLKHYHNVESQDTI